MHRCAPNKVKRITGVLDQRLGDFMFEPSPDRPVMVPHAIHPAGQGVEMYVINPTDRGIKIAISQVLGEAQELATLGVGEALKWGGQTKCHPT